MKMNIPNQRKLWRMRVQHSIHHKGEFPQAFSLYEALRVRQLIGAGLVAFFVWLKQDSTK